MRLAPILASLLVVGAACGRPAPDRARVTREVTSINGDFEPFDRTIAGSDPAELQRLIERLPPYDDRNTFCPIEWGLAYRLAFTRGDAPTMTALAHADGCRPIDLGAGDVRATNDAFWAALAGALGFSTRGNDLFPLPVNMRR